MRRFPRFGWVGQAVLFAVLCLLIAVLFSRVQGVTNTNCRYQLSNSRAILALGDVFEAARPARVSQDPAIRQAQRDYLKRIRSLRGSTDTTDRALLDIGVLLSGGVDAVKLGRAEDRFVRIEKEIRKQRECGT